MKGDSQELLMTSDVIKYLVNVMKSYGDLPCVLETDESEIQEGKYFKPLEHMPVVTLFQLGSKHKENCILFASEESLKFLK